MSAKDLARKIVPIVKQFVKDQIASRNHPSPDQPMIVGGDFRSANKMQNYHLPEGSQTAYQQQNYDSQSPQGREQD